jgi:hypothetical protein
MGWSYGFGRLLHAVVVMTENDYIMRLALLELAHVDKNPIINRWLAVAISL